MKLRGLIAGLATMVGLMGFAAGDPMGAVSTVTPGVWCSDFTKAKEYADKNNVPMLIFWANPGCSQCEKMEKACNGADFRAWMVDSGLVMVFGYGTSTSANKDCKAFVKNSTKEFPYMGVYWKSNTQGKMVLEKFTGRTGAIGHGTTKMMGLDEQLITATENILSDWFEGGDHPTPQPPAPCTHKWDAGKVTTAATCTKAGVKTYTCSLCQETKTETIAALGHDYVDGVCTHCKSKDPSYKPDPQPQPEDPVIDPQPEEPEPEREPVNVNDVYKKARTLTALVIEDGDYVGTAKISIGKINTRKGTVKVGCSLSLFTGKSASTSVTKVPDEYGSIEGIFGFKSSVGGAMDFVLEYNSDEKDFYLSAENDVYAIELGEVKIGGSLDTEELSFSADVGDAEPPDGYDFIVDAPSGEPVYVKKGTKFSFDKAPSIKYKKFREDGETWYELVGLDDENKTNVTRLKLSYKATTGAFTGSFKMYYSNEYYVDEGKSPKLKSVTVKVSGIIINGTGYGRTSVKIGGMTYVGACTLD